MDKFLGDDGSPDMQSLQQWLLDKMMSDLPYYTHIEDDPPTDTPLRESIQAEWGW